MERIGARHGIVTALACLLAACAQPPAASPPPAEPTQAMQAAETSTEARDLSVGGFLDLALPSNASTGYGWELVETGAPVLRRVDPPPAAEVPASPPMPGAGGSLALALRRRTRGHRAGAAGLSAVVGKGRDRRHAKRVIG